MNSGEFIFPQKKTERKFHGIAPCHPHVFAQDDFCSRQRERDEVLTSASVDSYELRLL